jgi:hypothetical protein
MATKWRAREIEAEKAKLKLELEEKFGSETPEESLAGYLLDQIFSDSEPLEYGIWHFVRVMKVLVLHKSAHCLSSPQVARLSKLAVQILKQAKVAATDSSLAYLYGEVEIVLSQIARNDGRHWQALWKAVLADSLIGNTNPSGEGFRILTIANRELRLGDTKGALDSFRLAETKFDSLTTSWWASRLGAIKTMRLSGCLTETVEVCEATLKLTDQTRADPILELNWEMTLAQALMTHNFDTLFGLFGREEFQHQTTYLVEGYLWRLLKKPGRERMGIPKMSFLLRRDNSGCRQLGKFFDVALEFDKLEDSETPTYLKVAALSEVLELSKQLVSIDKELLATAYVSLWLSNQGKERLSRVVAGEYRSLSHKLSQGKDEDLFRIAALL